jgi:hypothetical protein
MRDVVVGIADEIPRLLRGVDGQLRDVDVGHRRIETLPRALVVEEVDQESDLGDLAHRGVAEIDILDETARRVRLQPQDVVQVRAVHLQVFGEHVAHAAGHLTADRDATVPVSETAPANHDVLARHVHPAAVGISPGLDSDAIVARVERAVFDDNVATRFRVAANRTW